MLMLMENNPLDNSANKLLMALNLIFAGVCYGVTTYLTDKKMSV